MKHLALVFALALGAFVAPAALAEDFSEAQILTRAAPTTNIQGVTLANVRGFRVAVCAESAQTLSGAGVLHAYLYNAKAGLWMRNPSLDLTVSVTATSCAGAACRCQAWPDQRVPVVLGHRVLYATSGVTVSGGTTATVWIHTSTISP